MEAHEARDSRAGLGGVEAWDQAVRGEPHPGWPEKGALARTIVETATPP